jgi:hypothetical protein
MNSNSHFKTALKGYDEQGNRKPRTTLPKSVERILKLTIKRTPMKSSNRI